MKTDEINDIDDKNDNIVDNGAVTNGEHDNIDIDNDIDEDMKLTREDYLKILHHYQREKPPKNIKIIEDLPTSKIQKKVLTILGNKFCHCIRPTTSTTSTTSKKRNKSKKQRRIDYDTPQRRIANCTKSIFNRRGLKRHGFRCKSKTNKMFQGVTKTKKHISM
jgi:hypothetical protein